MKLTDQATTSRTVLSISQVNNLARQLLEDHLPLLWVEGEISNLARPSSGHWYFTLKDERAQIRCAMFKNRNRDVAFTPKQGDKVIVRGKVSLYEGRGDFQLIAEHMEESGFGQLQRQFELLKTKLLNEGLFDPSRKKSLPEFPLHIGIITSPTGAAVRDVLSVLKRRMPTVPVTIVPAAVQGREAAQQLISALTLAEQSGLFDILVLTRGGGSLEDLWCFNDESLARAIAECPIPIISAVGHEVDFTIADFVADLRAPTPSAAAEILSHNQTDLKQTLLGYQQLLLKTIRQLLREKQHKINHVSARLKHPGDRLRNQAQRLDHLELHLKTVLTTGLRQRKDVTANYSARLQNLHPNKQISRYQSTLSTLQKQLSRALSVQLRTLAQQLQSSCQRLDAISPLNTLKRGYAIAQDEQGRAITDAATKQPGNSISVQLARGKLQAEITEIILPNTPED
ncbi:exodeoxyribonuclease VII large subunit [Halioxenophilus sp. WMMB6]|uniref:exodeoxyribonuclease VII large subunit n=1 Tax=Halioxenophilus sp. WMMB6 TaxID=3073815 RepID=UPI00295EC0D8|nr:exodeoxyribonuclease VII large subunit [Halioxenophilus sp. WMMB6]